MKKAFNWLKTRQNIIPKKQSSEKWFVEWYNDSEFYGYKIKKIVAQKKSPYQKALLVDTKPYGRTLIIDEEIQSCRIDEHCYHEALVNPALIMHPAPKKALVIGAGEGATLRELLRCKTIEKIVTVDIDKEIIEFAKKYMRSWHRGAFDNKKVELIIADAKKYVYNTDLKFDIVISDLPCPVLGGPACKLYTYDFYKKLYSIMTKNGILAVQAGPLLYNNFHFHKAVYSSLSDIFKVACSYFADVPSFRLLWSFIYASRGGHNPLLKKADFFDRVISNKFKSSLKSIDGVTLEGMFKLPKNFRQKLSKNKRKSKAKKAVSFKLTSIN
jgi:spermidine synthase